MDDEPGGAKRRRMPDAWADELLGRLLHYRDMAEADPAEAEKWGGRALKEARQLVEGLTGWAAGSTPAEPPADPATRRRWISRRLDDAPHMPQWAAFELKHALAALDHGQVEPLLTKTRTRKRAKKPMEQAEAKWRLLAHAEWLAGRGMKMHEAKATVASAIGLAPENLDQWRYVEFADRPQGMTDLLRGARYAGEAEAMGYEPVGSRWNYVDGPAVRDLNSLAAAYRKATLGT